MESGHSKWHYFQMLLCLIYGQAIPGGWQNAMANICAADHKGTATEKEYKRYLQSISMGYSSIFMHRENTVVLI